MSNGMSQPTRTMELKVLAHFDAAHYLPGYGGKCANMHGHTWRVEVTWAFPWTYGIAADFKDLKERVHQHLDKWDHQVLNEKGIRMPTAEELAYRLGMELGAKTVAVWESPEACAIWREPDADE
jgi:6-pyruvoyltetrahydropterin/6-carboxytetrahydropterin synthase